MVPRNQIPALFFFSPLANPFACSLSSPFVASYSVRFIFWRSFPPHTDDTICPEFSILCSWIESLGFEESLVSGSDVSLFAPTDAAISRVFGASDTPDNDLVRDILRYHIVTGSVIELTDVDCDSGAPVTIPNGQGVEISCRDGTVFLAGDGNGADALPRITDPGIRACNGIVHAIDGLILGEAEDIDVGPGCQTFGTNATGKRIVS